MGLTKYEQEVIINFNAGDETATIYTSNPAWIRKMDKLVEQNPEQFRMYRQEKMKGKIISKAYEFPKGFVSIRSKKRTCNLTKEQREDIGRRLNSDKINSV